MKKISVIVTCFDLEDYLDETIDSIVQQVCHPFEVILVHDGCQGKPKAYDFVTTVFCPRNRGVAKARDLGFKMSTGDYVVFFDGDDVMPLNYLMEMDKVEADVIYPSCILWAGWGNSKMENIIHKAPSKITMSLMLKQNEVLMPSLFKREWYIMVGGFDNKLKMFEDYDFWLKCLEKGATFKKSGAILQYRQRSKSRNHQSDAIKAETHQKIVEKFTLTIAKDSKVKL